MDLLKEFNQIIKETKDIAIATSVDNIPNVRVVNYYYDEESKGKVYFSSFKNNTKTVEFSKNNKVSFTTIPTTGTQHVRVFGATVTKSDLTVYDLKDKLVEKYSSYEVLIANFGDSLDLYEIHFDRASVTVDPTLSGQITL
ncbi:pyridoxamine 5'-phosphate oxidase family protein [[Clostridium] dakarense]|uniref:pyridoxamine 5'-phosphate oxidase family protein n=1 Tax=Faecalimicrobium dakarense TaxID=1301100 RepID=UPI0004BA29EE|nr:pyridoxamine 5'-phosphate oxidase family protein [[Clostridium] dakarense]